MSAISAIWEITEAGKQVLFLSDVYKYAYTNYPKLPGSRTGRYMILCLHGHHQCIVLNQAPKGSEYRSQIINKAGLLSCSTISLLLAPIKRQ